jgi:hypothetical protein
MKINALIASSLLVAATAASAHVKVTAGPLAIDESSVKLVGSCDDNDIVSFNGDGSFDVLFNQLAASARGARDSKTCQLKFNAQLPKGWTIAVSKIEVGGLTSINSENGRTTATLRHTLGGSIGDAAIANFAYIPGQISQDVRLERDFSLATDRYLPCGGSVTFKSTINVTAWGDDADIQIDEAGQTSKQYNVRYYWNWKKC